MQQAIPFCQRCGCVHDRWQIATYAAYCQRCEDELAVESYWRMRAIFGSADAEAVFDRIYAAGRGLFERGVLPDYWYVLMLRNESAALPLEE